MPHRLCLSLVRRRLGGWQEIDAVVEDMQMRIEGDPELAPHFEADVHLRGHIRQYTVGSCSTGWAQAVRTQRAQGRSRCPTGIL